MSFSGDIKAFADKVEKNHNRRFRASALHIFKTIIIRTPVDTGRLINNWFTSIGAPVRLDSGETSKVGADSLSEAVTETGKLKNTDVIYMTNNLDYASAVENGSPTNRPVGMVKTTITEWTRKVEQG